MFERTFEYKFDKDYNLISGTETENGVVITYGADWAVTGRVASVLDGNGNPNKGFSEVSSNDLDALPTALKATGQGAKTYQSSETHGNNTEKTYYNASGKVLGYSFSWENDDGSSGSGYEDSERNWLGDSFSDPARGFTSSFSSEEIVTNGSISGYREKGTSKQVDPNTSDVMFERNWEFEFDKDWNLVSGTETEGLTTTVYKLSLIHI